MKELFESPVFGLFTSKSTDVITVSGEGGNVNVPDVDEGGSED